MTGKKIARCSNEELSNTLKYITMLIGLRAQNIPEGLAKDFLKTYIVHNYGRYTLQELQLAFDLAVQRKLNLKNEDVICYENFSIEYLGRIMSAYRAWASDQVKRLPEAPPPPKKKLTPAEKLEVDMNYALYMLKQNNRLPYQLKLKT